MQIIKALGKYFRKIIGYIYGGYLTIRFVDDHKVFPAIVFPNQLIIVRINKRIGAKLHIAQCLKVEPWLERSPVEITLGDHAEFQVLGDFSVGDGVLIRVSPRAQLVIGGRHSESGSGITARSLVMVKEKVMIGKDVIIGWDTFITDCDWHSIQGQPDSLPVTIGDHVWIGMSVKVLKGSRIGDDTIVASGAVVSGKTYPSHAVLGGVPARVIKTDVPRWSR